MNRLYLFLIALFVLFISCDQQNSQEELFDTVWQTIYDTYPDRTFGNKNWTAIGDNYRQQIHTAHNDDDIIDLLNQMLFELNVSHSFIGRISEIKAKASPYMFKAGSPEIDIRIIDDKVVVTRVIPNSQAEHGNLLPGAVIQKIDHYEVSKIISSAPIYPPYNERYKRFLQTEEVLRYLYGDEYSSVHIEYLDQNGIFDSVTIMRTIRRNKIQLSPDLPEIFLECEWKILDNNIGYIRFNAFQPENPTTILSAIDSLVSAKSIIIDLRGNNGGSIEAQRIIAERFFQDLQVGAFIEQRNQIDTLFYNGNENAITTPIAILVDEVSISGAELFPASLQSLGRAVIVGAQTPGAVMGGSLDFLTDDLVLVHPTLIIRANQGIDLEGVGVIPDMVVTLDRELLTKGIDNQLKAAVTYLTNKSQPND